MILANYIKDLLYRYDCVIVPNLGGFVTNRIGAKVNETSHTFYPPKKQITFNAHLTHNDGLLANYIANAENISFEKANQSILKTVNFWNSQLKTNAVFIENIGRLSLNKENNFVFEPINSVNYLTDAFGLNTYKSVAIARNTEKVIPIQTVAATKSVIPNFIKYAAAAAILLTVSFLGYKNYEQNQQQEIYANQEKALEKKIQSATFVISNPLPTIELNVAKEIPKPYHIIAGAFQFPENATVKMNQLKKDGYNAKILGINKWGLTQVSFQSFSNRTEAFSTLAAIKKNVSKDAWILIKTFK